MKNLAKALSKYLQIIKCKFIIVWNTRNIRSLFQIEDNLKSTAALFTKTIVCVVNSMSVNF